MSFTSLINLRHCEVKRKIDVLLTKTPVTANPAIIYQPPAGEPGCMEVHISGYPSGPLAGGNGFVTIFGTDINGLAIPGGEILTFTENGAEVGIAEFQTITSIVTTNLLPPFQLVTGDIEIRLVSVSGAPIYWEITIFDEMKCWIDMHVGGLTVIIPGGVITSITKLFCKHDPLKPLREADLVYYRNRKYRINFIEEVMDRANTPHHLELILEQAKTNES